MNPQKQLKLHDTRKLHYGEYLYKLVLHNPLCTIFRSELQKNGKLSYAREQLDILTEKYRNNIPLTRKAFRTEVPLNIDDYLDAKDVYSCLKLANNYKIRVSPYMTLILYTNDRSLLVKIINKMRVSAEEFWEPRSEEIELLKQQENIVIVDIAPQFPLKVWFNTNRVPSGFVDWIGANKDKARIGDKALNYLINDGHLNGYYMYIRDERVMQLVYILAGSSIRRIDKLIYNNNIDK